MLLEKTLNLIVLSLIIASIISHIVVTSCLVEWECEWPYWYTPSTLYRYLKTSWLECIIIYIILFPLNYIFAIGGFVKWLIKLIFFNKNK